QGLLYSYLGLIIGEFIAFLLVRYYGRSFVKIILSPNKYKKFEENLDKNEHNVKKLLIFTMLVPFAPDDIVCLVAVITDISLKEFMKID
ncbi:TVP38/TMEM64 family protein, partial [Enterococcus faecalis]|uniref:TVP38/TMEM64 family protein n=1 Tax=Enterococcus faecalis TaxID=1351 RepID=UPI003D6A9FA0